MKFISTLILMTALLASVDPVACAEPVALDMTSGWLRRDWQGCKEPSYMTQENGSITIRTEKSAALYWQIPTTEGPMAIDTSASWIRNCDRPPRDFGDEVQAMDRDSGVLLDASEHRHLSWKWRVSNTVDDSETVNKAGKVQLKGDDFAAKFGVILNVVRGGYVALAVLAVACSVVSAFFYMRVAVLMYMTEPQGSAPERLPAPVSAALAVAAFVIIMGGVFPGTFAAWTVPP